MSNNKELNQTVNNIFHSFEENMNGEKKTDWHSFRKASFAELQKIGFPEVKAEDYRYTPISRDLKKILDPQNFNEAEKIEDLTQYGFAERKGPVIYFINGVLDTDLSTLSNSSFVISTIKSAIDSNESIKDYYNQLLSKYNDAFGLLNSSFTSEGLLIKVPRNTQIEEKLSIVNIQSARNQKSYAQQRSLIVVEENASADIAEFYYTVGDNDSFLNQLTEIFVAENARLEFSRIGLEKENAYHIGNTYVDQKRSSHFNASSFTFGGNRVRNNLNISLDGEGIESHMNGLYLLTGNTHADHHTIVDHMHPHCESNELYKGIMDDQSTGVFNGKIFVRQDAQKTNAFQSNNNILLSEEASINAKPQLEIWADDVKCSHGCTTGQLDEESVFYMQSRGLDKKTATGVLLHAFAGEVIDNIKDEDLSSFLDQKVQELLHSEW